MFRAFWILAALHLVAAGSAPLAGDFDDARIAPSTYPDWFKDSFLDLRDDLDDALGAGKRGLMVLFATEGCSYCAEFVNRSLADPDLASLVQAHFDAVALEIFSDAEMVDPAGTPTRVNRFAEREGAGFAPTLAFYGDGGRLLYRGVGYHSPDQFRMVLDYLAGGYDRESSFRDYAALRGGATPSRVSAYRLRPDPLFSSPPYALDRSRIPALRPLMVIFETDGCDACAELHREVLALPEVRSLLERFDIVRLDARDSSTPVVAPDGRRTTPASWYAETGFSRLPALLFFEEGGREVLSTEALVLRQRMMNSLLYTLERAYEKQWTYQRFARSKSIERMRQPQ